MSVSGTVVMKEIYRMAGWRPKALEEKCKTIRENAIRWRKLRAA
jgi:hypothetical protein